MDAFAAEQFGVSSLTPFEDSTALLDDGERLRERAARDGYLFFRGLLDPDAIRQLREASLEVIDRQFHVVEYVRHGRSLRAIATLGRRIRGARPDGYSASSR